MSMAYMVIYTYTAELYNTKIRVLSMGFFNFISKISGVAMPLVVDVFYSFGPTGPFIIFGLLSLISSISIYTMKDTTNMDLDD